MIVVCGHIFRKTDSKKTRIIGVLLLNSLFYLFAGIQAFAFVVIYSLVVFFLCKICIIFSYKFLYVLSILILIIPMIISVFSGRTWSVLGISFFSFEAITLLIDVITGRLSEVNIFEVVAYIMFFPVITSGPICKYTVLDEGIKQLCYTSTDMELGLMRFVWGLSKKVLIADRFAVIADYYFNGISRGDNFSIIGTWAGAISYTIQIYMDFSGYSDMAIGIGKIIGFNIPENFDKPYSSTTLSEFWQRWHISLTGWFREYVYIPLGGNRCSVFRHVMNMTVVWMLTGLWHGVNFTFIIWAAGNLILLIYEKYNSKFALFMKGKVIGHIYTMLCIVLLWIPFRCSSVKDMAGYYMGLVGVNNSGSVCEELILSYLPYICIIASIALLQMLSKEIKNKDGFCGIYTLSVKAFNILCFVLCICVSTNNTYTPYIYGRF